MSEYLLSPRAVAAPFEPVVVALAAATTKTVLQVGIPAGTDIRIIGWGVSFDGASSAAVPGWNQLCETDVAATVGTTLTPDNWGNALAPASGMTAASTGYNASAEGTITAFRALDPEHVHPQMGYGVWFPEVRVQPRAGHPTAARFIRIRCKYAAIVNVIPWIVWAEPAI